MKKTKIVCTIGPKSESCEMLTKLVNAGMNVMRLNFSHGDFDEHGTRISNMRKVMKDIGKNVAILLDTKGPEIRTTKLKDGNDVLLKAGQTFTFTTDTSVIGDETKVAVTYEGFAKDLKTGNIVLVDDGLIALEVKSTTDTEVICEVLNNGELGEKKGVNLPNVNVGLPALSEKDKADLVFGCEQKVDFVAASFIRKKEDVLEIRELLKANGGDNIQIISKIENQEGVDNFDEILEVSDGIMVARGDLGVEIPVEEVIFAQKMMIKKCNATGKVVITATQMLDSMIKNPRPTRAEAGDVANAIIDGTDAVMLSGESAKGKYPEEAVTIMADICRRTDGAMKPVAVKFDGPVTMTEAISRGAVKIAEKLNAKMIVVATETGRAAKDVRKYFPTCSILALTPNEKTSRQLVLSRGVSSEVVGELKTTDEFHTTAEKILQEKGMAEKGDLVIMMSGEQMGTTGSTNMVRVHIID
jgi:pyruvate kinase